jgi:hypothetical protein
MLPRRSGRARSSLRPTTTTSVAAFGGPRCKRFISGGVKGPPRSAGSERFPGEMEARRASSMRALGAAQAPARAGSCRQAGRLSPQKMLRPRARGSRLRRRNARKREGTPPVKPRASTNCMQRPRGVAGVGWGGGRAWGGACVGSCPRAARPARNTRARLTACCGPAAALGEGSALCTQGWRGGGWRARGYTDRQQCGFERGAPSQITPNRQGLEGRRQRPFQKAAAQGPRRSPAGRGAGMPQRPRSGAEGCRAVPRRFEEGFGAVGTEAGGGRFRGGAAARGAGPVNGGQNNSDGRGR